VHREQRPLDHATLRFDHEDPKRFGGHTVAPKDIIGTISAADRLLEVTESPRHRRILENYRRHAILEVCGEWEGIFEPEMTVEEPVYYFSIRGFDGVVANGAQAVKDIYRHLAETQTCVMLVENEHLWIDDWGFASDSDFVTSKRTSRLRIWRVTTERFSTS
jgi:hypothetical protein